MARPRKNAADKMSERIQCWMTPDERKMLASKARSSGMSEPDYLRSLVRDDIRADRMRLSVDPAVIKKLSDNALELKAIGNNVNQLALAAHTGRSLTQFYREIGTELRAAIIKTEDTLTALAKQQPL